jgi:transglutaminase-like putative cysteine protease
MRYAFSFILCLFLVRPASAFPNVITGNIPGWLADTHPDLNKQPAPGDISDGYYYVLLDQQTNLLHNTDYTHFIKKVINESGVQGQSEVSVTFAPEFQQVIFHRICILRDGATLDQLQLTRIKVVQEETDAGDFEYNGLKRAFITLKDVRKGDRIEVAYSIVGFNPVFGSKYSDQPTFGQPTAICNYFKTIITTPDRRLHIVPRNNAPAPEEQRMGNTLLYRWINPSLKNSDYVSTAPSWFENGAFVDISEYNNWQEVVSWGLTTFNHYQYTIPASLEKKIMDWRKIAAGNKDRFANLAARFVQNEVRYLGLEMGPNTYRPHTPSEVYNGRFGDCKDKALLLSVILRHEGIPACVALINSAAGRRLPTASPAPDQFDHAIVAIERPGGGWLYIDPTISAQRGELTNLFVPDYGYSLLLRDGEDSLRPVTPGQKYDYYINEHLDANYYDTSMFSVVTTYTGGAADKIRSMLEETSMKDLEESYRKYYSSDFEGIRQAAPITWTDDSLKNELTVNEHYAIPSLWTIDKQGKKSFSFGVKIISEFLSDPSSAPAGIPLGITYPVNVHYTLNLSLPEGWNFGSPELHLKNAAYQFDFIPETDGKEMTLRYNLHTSTDNIPPADLAQYKTDYKNIEERIFFELYKNNTDAGPAPSQDPLSDHHSSDLVSVAGNGPKACWPAIWLTFCYALLFSRLFLRLNARSEETLYAPGSGYPLGGWIIILGISIGSTLLLESVQFLQSNYFSYTNWIAYTNAGGTAMQYLYLTQLAIHLSFIAGAGAVLYWFLKRRDIFPRMFFWYAGILLFGRLLLISAFHFITIPPDMQAYKDDLPLQFIRTCVYAGIWATYVLRSGQVRNTFLEPYRGA